MTTAILPSLPTQLWIEQIHRDLAGFDAALLSAARHLYEHATKLAAQITAGFQALVDAMHKAFGPIGGLDPAAIRRMLWTGIARRHAERPPTRGFWMRRCWCLACRERKGQS